MKKIYILFALILGILVNAQNNGELPFAMNSDPCTGDSGGGYFTLADFNTWGWDFTDENGYPVEYENIAEQQIQSID
ncbi:hypothetical protein EDL99_05750 [Ornithobacterium rhinotracheale]|uniref:hypothetical protein n=1 Tax=Ornithobacterium rhinotracheale TaxID=28251 RepID=UPI00129CEAA9|nr:hypothetical protein [Ornithobacterium rhinotracheale]MRJ08377.1 hypothetical protein [Ornithobacterium rhinotracheale]UOH77570.1 hypothetical protein MT996_10230 [Ornithobacterium rhinotracheale]